MRQKFTLAQVGLLLAAALFFPFCKADKNPVIEGIREVEPTLTASNPRLKLLAPDVSGIDFQNIIAETNDDNFTTNVNKYNGGGVAVADVNGDGLQDIYFVCSNGKNRLYLNLGGMKFRDATEGSGLESEDGFETAVTAADVNADGLLDFYVCRAGVLEGDIRRNRLFINKGNLKFSEEAKAYGLDFAGGSTGAAFFDYDLDGDLDLYLANYPTSANYSNKIESLPAADGVTHIPKTLPPGPLDSDCLYKNEGNGHFADVSKAAGINNFGYALSVSVADFNGDGWPDVYVGNDYHINDFYYENQRNGTFREKIRDIVGHTSRHTMGTDATDFDNDGQVDLMAVDMLPADNRHLKTSGVTQTLSLYTVTVQAGYLEPVVRNVLQRNMGNGTFADVGCLAGIFKTDWSWSGLLFDIDNDGLRDLSVTNGYRREVNDRDFFEFRVPEIEKKMSGKAPKDYYKSIYEFLDLIPTLKTTNYCYQNRGDWTFADRSGDWATMPASWSCGSAWADFDNDGDLDLVVNNLEDPAFLYQNLTRENGGDNYLQAKLQGPAQNPFGVGAAVLAQIGNSLIFSEVNPTRGIFSSVENLVHLGLGKAAAVDKLTIRWPDGKAQILTNVPANQRLILKYSDASGKVAPLNQPNATNQFFAEKTASAGLNWTHTEDVWNDFEHWMLNPWCETDLGPLATVGDVNGDGLDDFFVGNSFDHAAALFVQTPAGTFRRSSAELWEQEKMYEDHGAAFFDADGDGDQDLFVVSGGAEATSPLAWISRLYNNDGKGNFAKAAGNALPPLQDLGLRVAAHDADGDGDLDLFVGGRVLPGKWPQTPRSLVLTNDGHGRFADATAQLAPDFERIGMVTDLKFANLDGDAAEEMVVCGELMPLSVFKFSGGKWANVSQNFALQNSNGVWNRLAINDLDGDGDLDLVAGNLGLNTRFAGISEEKPLSVFAKDWDGKGQVLPLVGYPDIDGKIYPLPQKDLLNKNLPILKKKYIYSRVYGGAPLDELFAKKDFDAALSLRANTLATSWWENRGGKFVQHALPSPAQTAPANGILVADFTGDGLADILLAGNKYGMEVETNRCDAGKGTLLRGDGKGNFVWVENLNSGFWAQGEVRDLGLLRSVGGGRQVVVANNHAGVQVFKVLK